ncbi:MAG: hypothetical protein U5L11_12510 [Arhodomonas sp.]|nr:hypothetical protein [Arhodomonas sp.]
MYMSNNNYKNTLGSIRYIRETEYHKFVTLKKERSLHLSDYVNVWKVILYLLVAQQIMEREGGPEFLKKFGKLGAIQSAIDEYYHKAFSPEILQALEFVQESKVAAELLAKHAKVGGSESESATFSESRFQTNLFYIQKQFENALSQARLTQNHLLFIDGIDIRPEQIPYPDYLECIKGLANAVWEVNNDFFPSIKGWHGFASYFWYALTFFESLGCKIKIQRCEITLCSWTGEQITRTIGPVYCLERLIIC